MLLASAAGVQAVGLDRSQEMLDYAAQHAERAGVGSSVHFVCADMAAPGGYPPDQWPLQERVDLAAIMLGTLAHCTDNASALRCFRNVAE